MEKKKTEIQQRLDDLEISDEAFRREITKRFGITIARGTLNGIKLGIREPHASSLQVVLNTLHALEQDVKDGLPPGQFHDPLARPDFERSSWIPRIGPIAAGKPTDFDLNIAGDRDLPGSLYHAPEEGPAAIVATGDSMQPLIDDGDIVIIARKFWRAPATDDIVAVSLVQERGHTIKHLEILKDGRWILKPHNIHKHVPKTVEPSDVKAAAIVVGWYHAVHRPGDKRKK